MADKCTQPSSIGLVSAYKSTRGRPKKFPRPWNSVMKRIYISEDSWMAFRELKVTGGFSSDDVTLQFLLQKHKVAEEQSLQRNLSCSNSPIASAPSPIAPVYYCSTPTGTPSTSSTHRYPPIRLSDSMILQESSRAVVTGSVCNERLSGISDTHGDNNYTCFAVDTLDTDDEIDRTFIQASRILNEETSSSESEEEFIWSSEGDEETLSVEHSNDDDDNEHSTLTAVEDTTLTAAEDTTLTAAEDTTSTALNDATLNAAEDTTSTALDATLNAAEDTTLTAAEDTTSTALNDATSTALDATLNAAEDTTLTAVEDNTGDGNVTDVPTVERMKSTRYICSVNRLLDLAAGVCNVSNCGSQRKIDYKPSGCCIIIYGTCGNGHSFQWESSERLGQGQQQKQLHVDNLHFASAIVLSGNNYSKIEQFARFYRLNIISRSVFHGYQRNYICTGVNTYYKREQEKILTQFKDKHLVLAGDGRCDSPGSSAKFCTYSVMDVDSNIILHTETIDKRQVDLQSPNMERKAFIKSMDFLLSTIRCSEVITDASSSIRKTLETRYPTIFHSLDVWHKTKKLRKALAKAGKKKGMEKLLQWSNNIVNHMWYCCRTCNGDVLTLKVKWSTLLHHVVDEHEWITGACDHEPLTGPPTDPDGKLLEYFDRREPAFRVLQKLVFDRTWLKSLKYYTKFRHTGRLESFNNVVLAYASKRVAFQDQCYITRIQLSVLDHNMHLDRDNARNKQGHDMYARKFRKQTKKWDVTPLKERKTFSYIPEILREIEVTRTSLPRCNVKSKRPLPIDHPARLRPNIGNTDPDPTTSIVRCKKSRFE